MMIPSHMHAHSLQNNDDELQKQIGVQLTLHEGNECTCTTLLGTLAVLIQTITTKFNYDHCQKDHSCYLSFIRPKVVLAKNSVKFDLAPVNISVFSGKEERGVTKCHLNVS